MSRNAGGESGPTHPPEAPEEQLRYIREVMSRTSTFTAVPGWGAVFMGFSAFGAAAIAAAMENEQMWLLTWLLDALVAALIGGIALMHKARRSRAPLRSGAGRKFISGFLPALFAGGVLTVALWKSGQTALLPGVWMLLYGIGTWTGGAFSVRVVPVMGMFFVAAGTVTLFLPAVWRDLMMALTFGGLNIGFGFSIIRHHGG